MPDHLTVTVLTKPTVRTRKELALEMNVLLILTTVVPIPIVSIHLKDSPVLAWKDSSVTMTVPMVPTVLPTVTLRPCLNLPKMCYKLLWTTLLSLERAAESANWEVPPPKSSKTHLVKLMAKQIEEWSVSQMYLQKLLPLFQLSLFKQLKNYKQAKSPTWMRQLNWLENLINRSLTSFSPRERSATSTTHTTRLSVKSRKKFKKLAVKTSALTFKNNCLEDQKY